LVATAEEDRLNPLIDVIDCRRALRIALALPCYIFWTYFEPFCQLAPAFNGRGNFPSMAATNKSLA
jgi:hypothetical protein